MVLVYGGIYLIAKIFESIGNYIEKTKSETRERIYRELFVTSNVQEIFEESNRNLMKIGYDRESVENYQSEFYQSIMRTPYQEILGKCPSCNEGYLKMRIGRYGKFIGCSKFPNCHYTTDIQTARAKNKASASNAFKVDFKKAYS